MSDTNKNKVGKFKSNHMDIFGMRFCLKVKRSILNKANPELRGKKLDIKDLPKINAITKKTKKFHDEK